MAIRHTPEHTERVERIERVEERPVLMTVPPATNVNVGASEAPPEAPSPVWTVTRVVALLFTALEIVLLLRFTLKMLAANPAQPLVAGLYAITDRLVVPFQGIFPEPQGPPLLDIAALLAIAFLFLVAALMVALVRAIAGRTA